MLVKLKNVGKELRVVYDRKGQMHTIPIGQSRTIDLPDVYVDRFRSAQHYGDTLHVSGGDDGFDERQAEERKKRVKLKPKVVAGKRDPLDHDGDGRKGGSLPKAQRKGEPNADKTEKPTMTASELLAKQSDYDYHGFLREAKAIIGPEASAKLGPRPKSAQVVEVLAALANDDSE